MKRGTGVLVGLIVVLAFAANASASTYCVPTGGGPGCTNAGALTLQQALTNAATISGPDTVRVAAGTISPVDCNVSGFTYNSSDPLTLVGVGFASELTCPDNTGSGHAILDLSGAAVTVSDLSIHIPKGIGGQGVSLFGGVAASGLTVTSDPTAGNVIPVRMTGGSLQHSLIGAPLSDNFEAVLASNGALLNDDSINGGGVGVDVDAALNQDVTIVHSRISARRGVVADSFGATVTDTMIDVLPGSGSGPAGGLLTSNTNVGIPLTITARNVSIVGTAPGSIGVDVEALVPGQTASATVTDTVIHGPPTALKRSAVANSTANLTTNYDAYAAGNYTGTGAGTTTQLTPPVTGDPGFAAPADPHVSASSPLIDAGTPGGLAAGEPTVDLDGNPRILDGNHDCVSRRDIGAYEFINSPTVHASASAAAVAPGQRVTFHATGCSIDPASSVTFSWQFDDGGTATGATVSHAFARAAVHRATVTIRDAASRISATSVSVTVKAPAPTLSGLKLKPARFHVVRKRHKHFKLGTTISYTDSLAATTTFTVTQRVPGVVKGKRCVAPPRHPAKRGRKPKRCTRTITLGTFTHRDKAGPNSVKWAGTLKRHALKPGTYTLRAVAKAGGRKSRAVSARFTVLG